MLSSFTNPHLSSTTKEILRGGRVKSSKTTHGNDENNVARQNWGDGKRLKEQKNVSNAKSAKTPGAKMSGQQSGRRALGDISNRKSREFGGTLGTKKNVAALKTTQPEYSSATKHRATSKRIDKQSKVGKNVSFGPSFSKQNAEAHQPSAVSLRTTPALQQPCLKQKGNLSTTMIHEEKTSNDDGSSVSSIEYPAGRMYHQEPDFGKNDLPPFEIDIALDFDDDAYMKNISEHFEKEERSVEESFERRAEKLYQEDLKDLTKSFGYPEDKFTLEDLLAEHGQLEEEMLKQDYYDSECDISL